MSESFHNIAGEIIQDSIKSAVFIDDEVLLPFEKKNPDKFQDHSNLQFSFQEKGCSLSYYRYGKTDWISMIPFLFENRDLLILDWELSDGPGYQNETLKILEKAIQTPSLHFCIIYTETETVDFDREIILPCLSYFSFCSEFNLEEQKTLKDDFIKFCEKEIGVDHNKVFSELDSHIKEMIFFSEQDGKFRDARKKINKKIAEFFGEDANNFRAFLSEKSTSMYTTLVSLLYAFEEPDTIKSDQKYKFRVSSIDDIRRLYINNTIILIGNKSSIEKSGGLYDVFKSSLIEEHNIFLALLGLEIRNLFRNQSGFIGKDLDDIDETAFFYHHKTIKPKQAFYEFLRELWIDQSTTIFNDQKLKLYSTIDEYKANAKIDEKVTKFEKDIESEKILQEHLIRLNNFYNQVKFTPTENDTLSFGDIIKIGEEESFEYLICVTPLCDCVEPAKIEKQYFFVRQENIITNYVSALENAEGEHISFIKDADEIVCIDWGQCKSFSLYVSDPKLNSLSKVNYKNKWINLQYVGRIKENFAQRIANKALGYPARVGVSLAQIH